QLEMSGNPAKFLQGHNLFGSDDSLNLFFSAGMVSRFNFNSPFPVPSEIHSLIFENDGSKPPLHILSEYRETRIDLTRSYRFDSNEEARAWLRSVGATAHSRHRIKNNLMSEGTVYFGKNSTRWSFKMYQKFDEITSGLKGHGLSKKLSAEDCSSLTDWAVGVVRFELTLRRPEIEKLKQGFNRLDVWKEYYGKIQFNENARGVEMITTEKLTKNQILVLDSWAHGRDIRGMYSKNAFYTVRRQILNAVDIDISVAPVKKDVENVEGVLKESGWDPAPIVELMVNDFDDVGAKQYGF
ncbi:MAG: phage/plasmid replication protein, II/X family, partial [Candidatus Gottesmanbacteria bacterium]|nr:phage/plasmid replication protein, II/X family [Candidatus Gottesmanbacteria bacterium]